MQVQFQHVDFVLSAFAQKQFPETPIPEIAFAGRSNVGKSSLINRLIRRNNYVKTSSKPGKTQSLNFFLVDEQLHLVDLPGYGYAKVPRQIQNQWQSLITSYLQTRVQLALVVVIVDLRHEPKVMDRELIDWLRYQEVPTQVVYTKADKLSKNKQQANAAALDAGFNLRPADRILFSSKSGLGLPALKKSILEHCDALAE